MRAIHFMMIDYIKVKQQLYFMPLFIVIALVLWGQGFSFLMPFSYMIFVAIIFATAPFGACKRGDAGFLVLLPSTAAHRVMGRFLYGMSFAGLAVVCSGIFMAYYQITGYEIETWTVAVSLFILAFCILVITLEFLLLYLVGEHLAPQLLGIVRVAPAMASFFAIMYVMDDVKEMGNISMDSSVGLSIMYHMGSEMVQIGGIAVAAALAIWAAAIVICVKVTKRRDFV